MSKKGKNRVKDKMKDKSIDKVKNQTVPTDIVRRTRYPAGNELIGVVIRNLGARRMEVLCSDQIKRTARIPGRFRRGYRITVNDVVLIEPWDALSGDRADITYRYKKNEIRPLSKRYKKELESLEIEIPREETGYGMQ